IYSFIPHLSPPPPHLHSFPTRRSSDLPSSPTPSRTLTPRQCSRWCSTPPSSRGRLAVVARPQLARRRVCGGRRVMCGVPRLMPRSEEHTSELQSRFDLVCRLLLEKTQS